MAVNDAVGGVLSDNSVFRPASGVSIMLTAYSNIQNGGIRLRTSSTVETFGAEPTRTLPLPPVFINNSFYIEANANRTFYSGVQVA